MVAIFVILSGCHGSGQWVKKFKALKNKTQPERQGKGDVINQIWKPSIEKYQNHSGPFINYIT